jgi:lipopolysaccharide export LptBFGC system permease protein LptF
VPKTLLEARLLFKHSDFSYFPSLIKSKHFNDNTKNLTIFIEDKDPKGNFINIFVKEKFDDNNSQIINSKTGRIIEKNKKSFLVLYNGNIVNLEKEKTTNIKFDKFELNLSSHKSKTVTHVKIQETNSYDIIKCVTSYYFGYTKSDSFSINAEIENCSTKSIQQIKKEFAQRLFGPIYILIIGLISSSLILKSKSNQIYNKYKTFIFLSGIIIIILSEISSEYIGSSLLHMIFNLSLPILLSILFYLTILILLKIRKQSQ